MSIPTTCAAFIARFTKPTRATEAAAQLSSFLGESWMLYSSLDLTRALPEGWSMRRSPDYDVVGDQRVALSDGHKSCAIMRIDIHGVRAMSYSAAEGVTVHAPFSKNTAFVCDVITVALDEAISEASLRGLARIAANAQMEREAKMKVEEPDTDFAPG